MSFSLLVSFLQSYYILVPIWSVVKFNFSSQRSNEKIIIKVQLDETYDEESGVDQLYKVQRRNSYNIGYNDLDNTRTSWTKSTMLVAQGRSNQGNPQNREENIFEVLNALRNRYTFLADLGVSSLE